MPQLVFSLWFGARGPDFAGVDTKIRDRLFELRPIWVPESAAGKLKKGNALLNVFYHLVDGDESLSVTSRRVMFEGFCVTSAYDAALIMGWFAAFGLLWAVWTCAIKTLIIALLLYISAVGSRFWLAPRYEEKHMEICNEQLNKIEQIHRAEASRLIGEVWQNVQKART